MRTDLHSEILVQPAVDPAAAKTANAVTTGATIDSQGYESLEFVAQSGVITDGAFAGAVYGGNASNMSDEVQLSGNNIIGANLAFAATDDSKTFRQGINIAAAGYRYYRLKLTQSGATSGGFIAALAILARPRFAPTTSP